MIVVSAQLTDWGNTSVRQAIELTEYFIENFADESSIAAYASQAVDWVQAVGIMSGVGDNRFAPWEMRPVPKWP